MPGCRNVLTPFRALNYTIIHYAKSKFALQIERTALEPTTFPDLSGFFRPRRAAFIGATEDQGKFGGRCVRRLIDFGFQGPFYPVNPGRSTIFGFPCFASISEVPERPDHVGIVLAAQHVPAALEACASIGIPFATVFSSGFGETGTEEGRALEQRVVDIARAGGMRIMGPNCNGMINFVDGFALTSTAAIEGTRPPAGDIGIVSQSGGAGQVNVMWRAQQAGLGISYQVSCGNCADLDLLDYMAFMIEDPHTQVVLALAERISDGRRLAALASRAAELDKPIVMVKVGRTAAGSRAAASHTGAITGADDVCDAALRQYGIIRVDDTSELYETAMMLRGGRRPTGRGLAAASVSGGNLVMVTDLGAALGMEWPQFSDATQARLGERLPGFSAASNPADLTSAAIGQQGTFAAVLEDIAGDPAVDVLMPVLTISSAKEIRSVADVCARSAKPMPILWTGRADDPQLTPSRLASEGHAVFRDALPCLKALRRAMDYVATRARLARPDPQRPAGIDATAARAMLDGAGGPLSEAASKALLVHYGLPITREAVVQEAGDAVQWARQLGSPVALKVQSPDIAHKTEANALRLGVAGDEEVRQAFEAVVAAARDYRPGARIEGVLVQEMISGGHEVLIGMASDPTFGPVLTVGLGGIYVEVLKDVAFRLPPVDTTTAREMLNELRAAALLEGARGHAPADVAALVDCIVRVSWLAADLADRITELDINPLRVLPQGQGVRVVDALVVVNRETVS